MPWNVHCPEWQELLLGPEKICLAILFACSADLPGDYVKDCHCVVSPH